MRFRLVYSGDLKPRGSAKLPDIHNIRKAFHSQLKTLWTLDPLEPLYRVTLKEPRLGKKPVIDDIVQHRKDVKYFPLISKRLDLVAHLDILFLRPEPPGSIIKNRGDIDNRLKTLLDALKVPSTSNCKSVPLEGVDDEYFYTLLEDDSLVTKVTFDSDRLLIDGDKDKSIVIIYVTVGASRKMMINMELTSF